MEFSIWNKNTTTGAIRTNSEIGLDFKGVTFWDIATKEDAELTIVNHERYKNGLAPNPDSIMISYDIPPTEVYQHYIKVTSPTTASYYVNSKLISVCL